MLRVPVSFANPSHGFFTPAWPWPGPWAGRERMAWPFIADQHFDTHSASMTRLRSHAADSAACSRPYSRSRSFHRIGLNRSARITH